MNKFKKLIATFLPKKLVGIIINIKNEYFDGYSVKSYSQEGEDLLINRILKNRSNGFYIDVGAHHPERFSNTNLFYKKGWYGINIEPNPDLYKIFIKKRKRDININLGVSNKEGELSYYFFNEPALNGFCKEISEERDSKKDNDYKIIKKRKIKTVKLKDILDKNKNKFKDIDFLTIDTEGLDLEVLKSNDWNKYRPKIVLVEVLDSNINEFLRSDINDFLRKNSYYPYSKLFNSVLFLNKNIDL